MTVPFDPWAAGLKGAEELEPTTPTRFARGKCVRRKKKRKKKEKERVCEWGWMCVCVQERDTEGEWMSERLNNKK